MSAHTPSRNGEATALRPMPMTPAEIADLVARARVWRAQPWYVRRPTDRNHVGRLIRRWRKSLGWSAQYLADNIGVSETAVRLWERGVSVPQERYEAALRERGCPLPEIVRANRRGQRGTTTQKEAA